MKIPRLIIYEEMVPIFEKMDDLEAGKLVKDMISYFYLDKDEREEDMAWLLIKSKMDAAKAAYNRCVENGKKGGRPKNNGFEEGLEKKSDRL